MVDEVKVESSDVTSNVEAPAADTVEKKTRKPGRPKKAAEATSENEESASGKAAKKTRAKRAAKGTTNATRRSTRAAVEGAQVDSAPEEARADVGSIDGLAELLALEEENKSLRKQLSEKLRAENADLRKRLGQN